MPHFHAQPYDISATGFYFDDAETYGNRIGSITNDYGQPVEEFEIQFIDGEALDCAFANAFGLSQANILRFLELVDLWDDHEKIRFIIAVGECGYDTEQVLNDIDGLDMDIYGEETLHDLAERFVADGLFGDIPEPIRLYIDYEAIARDLAVDYTETEIGGERLVYRCG